MTSELKSVDLKLVFPIEPMDAFLKSIGSEWCSIARARCSILCANKLEGGAAALQEQTPRWSHTVTRTNYNSAIAKKQLLSKDLSTVADAIDMVESLQGDLANICAKAKLQPSLAIQEAQGTLDSARLAMSVVAAVNCLEKFATQPEGPTMAADLVGEAGLPDILKSKLRTLASK